jgi:hypothetical protein
MDSAISKLLDEIPEKPTRSKLEPHAEVIAALRRKRRTFREIAQFFEEHLAITVAPSTIHDFVRVRRRRREKRIKDPSEEQAVSSRPVRAISATENDVQQRIAALKRRLPLDQPQPLFTYEEDEPLKLQRQSPPAKAD